MLACSRTLHALRTWHAHVLLVLARVLCVLPCLECSTCLCACVLYELSVITCLTCLKNLHDWRASKNGMLRVLHKIGCLACFIKWYSWHASKNGSLGVLHKMVCLKFLNFFLTVCVCDHRALVNCRSWMRSDVFNGSQEIAKFIIKIIANFVFVLNLKFLTWILSFVHIYRI